MAIVEERQRLARELHDSVTQALYSVNLYAEAARMALSAGKADVATDNLQELRNMVREAMLDMRMLIFELHPPALEEEGLATALQTRLEAVEARSGLRAACCGSSAEPCGRLRDRAHEHTFSTARNIATPSSPDNASRSSVPICRTATCV